MSRFDHASRREFLSSLGALSLAGVAPALGVSHASARTVDLMTEHPAGPSTARGLAAPGDFLLDPTLVYLQTGSMGPSPAPVMQRTIEAWRELERNPTFFGYGAHEQAMERVREQAAGLLGCTRDELVLTTSTTDGMNRVAQGLSLAAGDRVLTTDQEHPGGRACWDYLVRTRGIVLDVVNIAPDDHSPVAIVDRLTRAITPRTRVLSFSHVLSSTGLRMPVAELCAAAASRGCLSVVDGAQAVGGMAVHVKTLGCDVYVTSGHKWLLAPKGTGLLYLRAELAQRVDPIELQSGRQAYTASTGVGNIPGVLGLGAAIDYLHTRGIANIEQHNLSLRQRVFDALRAIARVTVLSPADGDMRSPLLSYRLPSDVKADVLQRRLHEQHQVFVKVVPGNWFNGHRISTHLFNTVQDVDALARALRAELD